jgi:predicted nuclease of predicted toxin-antitoxin system
MNLLADEGVDQQIVTALRDEGFTVWYVAEMSPSITDETVLSLAREKQALLITSDKDFGELIFRLRRHSYGVLLLRLAGLSGIDKVGIVVSVIKQHLNELFNSFTVVTPQRIRIRKLFHSDRT